MTDTTTPNTTETGTPDALAVADFDPLEPATLQCPYAWYQTLRAEAPVHFVPSRGMWFVTSYELSSEAALNHEVFSSNFGLPQMPPPESVAEEIAAIQAEGWPAVPTLLTADPPEHHYYRRMVGKAFTPRLIAEHEPSVRTIAADLVGQIPAGQPFEFVTGFAAPLPLQVIARVLNVSADRTDDFKLWSDQFTASVGAVLDDAEALEQARQNLAYQKYFAAELDERRANPSDDLLSGLVTAPSAEDGDEPLSTAACLSIIQQLLIAGNETSTKLLTGLLHQLVIEPRWWDWLREDPAARSAALVEEGLRFLTPVQSMFRITKAETTLGGTTIPAGSMVVLTFGAANRDEKQFAAPEEFNPERSDAKGHLAFGTGIHACPGSRLARMEAQIALEELAGRFTTVRFGDDNDFAYEPSFMLRGLHRLTLVFDTEEN
ncbi:cytochrome P450 [Mycobacterium sp. 1274756.6]|uniref:cytochrome P450 n=1 Tax=Mycobacterium sp. 1274756.6 TaxID=1834076 RepID=UPI0007FE842E|nr:cytochrome P450 [Mycobacterium sp. 1274756.6]OBJ73697.1 hypothetical protein A5643_02820 [Mycobacterium sp. 1274756.6]